MNLTKEQFQQLDGMCEKIGLSTLMLMENAGKVCADYICKKLDKNRKFAVIVVGPGNNGGDGLVCARHLVNYDFNVQILLTESEEKYISKENAVSINYKIVKNLNLLIHFWDNLSKDTAHNIFQESFAIVDAIFGVGLNRTLNSKYQGVVNLINEYKGKKMIFAIDVPSGLDSDTGEIYGEAVKADYTLSFTAPKICFANEKLKEYLGYIAIFDIGIPLTYVKKLQNLSIGRSDCSVNF